jgi:serine/threonine protein phosphatase PrpC
MGELAVSRAIGDHCLRPYVIPEPELLLVERCAQDEVLVLASDGLWDVVSNQEAVDMALHALQVGWLVCKGEGGGCCGLNGGPFYAGWDES